LWPNPQKASFQAKIPQPIGGFFIFPNPCYNFQELSSWKNMRKTEFANGEYYHIYNRGVDKREVF